MSDKPKYTVRTKQLLVIGIIAMAVIVSMGWAIGKIEVKDALLILLPIQTGFFTMLKGTE